MKKVSLFLALAGVVFSLHAQQFTNGNFETWNGNSPQGWNSLGYMGLNLCDVSKSADAHSGNSAVRIAPKQLPAALSAILGVDMAVPGFLTNGTVNMERVIELFTSSDTTEMEFSPEVITSLLQNGLTLSEQPASINGYYKFDQKDVENDMFLLQALLFAGEGSERQIVGMGTFAAIPDYAKDGDYQPFTIELMPLSEVPATELIFLALVSTDEGNTTTEMSSLLLDDVAIVYASGLEKLDLNSPVAVYPNPCNGNFSLNAPKGSSIRITDALGREVKRIEHYDNSTISLNDKGIYFVNINNKEVGKLIVR